MWHQARSSFGQLRLEHSIKSRHRKHMEKGWNTMILQPKLRDVDDMMSYLRKSRHRMHERFANSIENALDEATKNLHSESCWFLCLETMLWLSSIGAWCGVTCCFLICFLWLDTKGIWGKLKLHKRWWGNMRRIKKGKSIQRNKLQNQWVVKAREEWAQQEQFRIYWITIDLDTAVMGEFGSQNCLLRIEEIGVLDGWDCELQLLLAHYSARTSKMFVFLTKSC